MPRAPFITFEGPEGCGKSTQVRRVVERLKRKGIDVFVTREPGGTAIGEKIRDLLQFAPEGEAMKPETELLLFEASRAQLVREQIEPALAAGRWVIADRFADSTTVYQGAARQLDAAAVEFLNKFAVGTSTPDLTLVLLVDLETARARMLQRQQAKRDRMEEQPLEFYQRVDAAYRELVARERPRVVAIDAAESIDEVEARIWSELSARFADCLTK